MSRSGASGPLAGVRVLEFAGIGPGPYAAMLLSDMGADVVRIDRAGQAPYPPIDIATRGRALMELDLRNPDDLAVCREAAGLADVLIDPYRPGVMERLGLGPEPLLERNPRLIYGRMTGWGQEGPLSATAGHDINYIALTGALAAMGPADRPPPPPLNLVGDYGGGALFLVFGIVAALYERERSGRGQVVDAAIVDGTASMMTLFYSLSALNPRAMERGRGGLAGGLPNYRCYECSDGRFVAVGCLEDRFHAQLLAKLGSPYSLPADPADAERNAELLAAVFRTRTRDEWASTFEDTDACVTPVLDLAEAAAHPHMSARAAHVTVEGQTQPAPAPRLSRTPGRIQGPAARRNEGGRQRIETWRGAAAAAAAPPQIEMSRN